MKRLVVATTLALVVAGLSGLTNEANAVQQYNYGAPQMQAQAQYGQPQYAQPQYGQPQYGQPQYGQPQYGQPQYVNQPQMVPAYAVQPQVMAADGYGVAPAGIPLGRAKLLARRAAIVDAQRGLVEVIKGTAVNSVTTVANLMVVSDVINTKVTGILTGAKVVSEDFQADGTYHVVMEVPMFGVGSVAEAVLTDYVPNTPPVPFPQPTTRVEVNVQQAPVVPSQQQVLPNVPPVQQPAVPAQPPTVAQNSLPAVPVAPQVNSQVYTGLVIDASGTELVRTFCPGIFDTNGRVIYGVENVDKDYAISHGIAEYADGSANWAKVDAGNSRAGSNPLVIKAVGVRERIANKCDVVVSVEDAEKILLANQRNGILNKYAVVIKK